MRFKKYAETDPAKKTIDLNCASAQAILAAARECFMEKEYTKVTFREIAKRADVTSGLIPYYFSSKEKLASMVYTQLMDELALKISMVDIQHLSSATQFYVTVYLQWVSIDESPAFSRFYYSLCENTSGQYWGNGDTWGNLVKDFCKEYHLEVSDRDSELFQIANRGATRDLILQRYYRRRYITREEVMDIITSNLFYNYGMSDEQIYHAIQHGKEFLAANFPDKINKDSYPDTR